MKKIILLLMSLIFILSLTSCHHVIKGDKMLMSNEQELKLGAQVHKEILKEFKLYKNPQVKSYVVRVGKKIVSKCDRKDIPYKFFILDTDMVNAFAGPGGYVYVTTGTLMFMKNEAELACILGHEVGHITERHAAKRMREVMGYKILAVGLAVGGVDIAGQILGLGMNLALNGYSQKNEYEADEKGIIYANRAGYNPHAMQNLFLRLEEKSKNKNEYNTFNRMLSSHPPTRSRINRAHKIQDEHNMMGLNARKYYAKQFRQIQNIISRDSEGLRKNPKIKKGNRKPGRKKNK